MTAAAIHVTRHAAERYVERINPYLTLDEAAAAIRAHTDVCCKAASFGCWVVLTREAKLLLDGRSVVTVLHRKQITPHRSQLS